MVNWDSIDHAANCVVWGNPADGGIDATLGLDAPCDCGAVNKALRQEFATTLERATVAEKERDEARGEVEQLKLYLRATPIVLDDNPLAWGAAMEVVRHRAARWKALAKWKREECEAADFALNVTSRARFADAWVGIGHVARVEESRDVWTDRAIAAEERARALTEAWQVLLSDLENSMPVTGMSATLPRPLAAPVSVLKELARFARAALSSGGEEET
jgi:hypothetical protein